MSRNTFGEGDAQAVRLNSAGQAQSATPAYTVYRHRGLLATVERGGGRTGVPALGHAYDAHDRPHHAREAQVAALVAGAKLKAKWRRKRGCQVHGCAVVSWLERSTK